MVGNQKRVAVVAVVVVVVVNARLPMTTNSKPTNHYCFWYCGRTNLETITLVYTV